MASSRNSVPAEVAAAVAEFVRPGDRVGIALSGGMDSMVLLDALAALAPKHPFTLSAIHVDHGLSAHAPDWARFCAERCAELGVSLAVHRLTPARMPGESLEAWARAARYARLRAADVDVVALAHHADDQAETLLLQLLRGAGPRGLSAMPRCEPSQPALLRPLLALPRTAVAEHAARRALTWVDDESNATLRHRRNFLRHEVAPLLAGTFPGYPATLLRAAAHQAEAAALLDDLARLDAAGALDADGLARDRLAALPPPRARNLLRWFLRQQGLAAPSAARLAAMLRQLTQARVDAQLQIGHDGAFLGCHRGRIVIHAPPAEAFAVAWHGEPELMLPGGRVVFVAATGTGIAAAKLRTEPVELRSRAGGERLQLAPDRPRRALKRLLHEAGLPAWTRRALPLVWCGRELVAVPGIGVATAFRAAPGEAAWTVEWCANAAAAGAPAPPPAAH